MIQTKVYSILNQPTPAAAKQVVQFLYTHLEQYGDRTEDIQKAFEYAMMRQGGDGGCVVVAEEKGTMIGAAIINKTGMEGYIPENILVYIATHGEHRGKGIASTLMNTILDATEGNIALHVEHDNPAIHLYKKFGFTNKYLEMRLNKKELMHGIRNA